jgi:hypothetical protein
VLCCRVELLCDIGIEHFSLDLGGCWLRWLGWLLVSAVGASRGARMGYRLLVLVLRALCCESLSRAPGSWACCAAIIFREIILPYRDLIDEGSSTVFPSRWPDDSDAFDKALFTLAVPLQCPRCGYRHNLLNRVTAERTLASHHAPMNNEQGGG